MEGSGDPILLIHSLGASLDWWDLTIPVLTQNHRVYAIDMPGFGLSDSLNGEVTNNFITEFMKDLLDIFEIQDVTLIGHSMGGYVVLRTALNTPDRVKKIVLVASAGFGKVQNPILKFLSYRLLGDIAAIPSKCGVQVFINSLVYDKHCISKERVETAFGYFKRPGAKKSFLSALRGRTTMSHSSGGLFQPGELGILNVPVLIMWGKQDRLFPISQAERASEQISTSRLHSIDNCGHIPQIEHPNEFNTILCQFLT